MYIISQDLLLRLVFNLFHLLLQISGTHCQVICHPFQLFLLLEELSNITCSCLLTLTVVRNLVRSNQLNLSRFVIHRQLLPSHSSEMPCRPYKCVPSERLRLVKWFISHRLHTGACVNLALLTYLLTYWSSLPLLIIRMYETDYWLINEYLNSLISQ